MKLTDSTYTTLLKQCLSVYYYLAKKAINFAVTLRADGQSMTVPGTGGGLQSQPVREGVGMASSSRGEARTVAGKESNIDMHRSLRYLIRNFRNRINDNTKPSARMGRKAYWVSSRQPGRRNIVSILRARLFFARSTLRAPQGSQYASFRSDPCL